MKLRGLRGLRRTWSFSSVRLRLLAGLAALLVCGLTASAVISAFLLEDFLDRRYEKTLETSADRFKEVIERGPQTADADQLGTLLGPPLGLVVVGEDNKVLLSTGSASVAAGAVTELSSTVPAGSIVRYDGHDEQPGLAAIRVPSPGLTVDRGPGQGVLAPAALVLTIDTSVDDITISALIKRQVALVGGALLLLLGLAVLVLRLGLRPLARMARTADAIAEGHLTERLPTTRNGSEAGRLAEAVNRAFDAQARAEATVRSLAADTSHELRTPLSTISGWLDLHRQGGISGPALETALEHIENEVGRMRLLVEDLALLARLDAGRPVEQQDVDLTGLAAGVVEDAQIIYPRRGITMSPAPSAPVVGDAHRLQQVVRNLVGNAVQHTPARTAVRVDIVQDRDAVHLRVVDNGPGISPQDLPRVFERFWRAEASRSRAYGGSGLGLAIVEAIVHAHHGQVHVRSEVGVGTTVTIRLPHAPRES
ncbi:two-component system OmpR family sensor kinase [Streptomyces aurantiacus]|uniref:sensor histidine kinase n=1 Tax=Streptomyces aurantiacus TaxID=47760 RepID=UPI0027918688|nr:HAMP domain-containing sensor histidine kinase [Streptomyces aurantiacus]MDQ0772214.1 two-component system OmpR family sensor kinase [Streptomyces aurantiacus]